MGRVFILLGVALVFLGLMLSAGIPIGRLPGDFAIRRGNVSFYFPLTTSIAVSLLLTLLMMFLSRK